ncbi:hypothetical protein [Rhodococcus sp. NPDC060176]|uniref:hypothetical protein n=1 Tax=Rhodococcus sp. NPDC060176 TaxID=3347062 RepID=UPI003656A15C
MTSNKPAATEKSWNPFKRKSGPKAKKPPRFDPTVANAIRGQYQDPENQPPAPKPKPIAKFLDFKLFEGEIEVDKTRYPVAGAKAIVDIGGTQYRTSMTRVALGATVAPVRGAIAGAMAKKQTHTVYLTIEFADGQTMVVEHKGEMESAARHFAALIQAESAKYQAQQGLRD